MSDTDSTEKVVQENGPSGPISNNGPSSGPAGPDRDADLSQPSPEAASKPPARPSPASSPAPQGSSQGPSLPRKPQIGDTRPAPPTPPSSGTGTSGQRPAVQNEAASAGGQSQSAGPGTGAPRKRRRRRGKGGGQSGSDQGPSASDNRPQGAAGAQQKGQQKQGARGQGQQGSKAGGKGQPANARSGSPATQSANRKGDGRRGSAPEPVELDLSDEDAIELDDKTLKKRSGRSRKGRAVGRYQMNVHVASDATQISILEGRALLEHYVSRPSDDISQIHGNIYVGRVENVLPGMEAAFVDIATPKNAVLYRGDVQYDPEDVLESGESPRIEDVLKPKQLILCQVTKNPIAHKGARLTQEVSLAGRFVVLVPNSRTYGISKRLPDDERKRLRKLLDRVKPQEHGLIVRTAASGVTTEEVERDILRLLKQWSRIEELAAKQDRPGLIYREPELAVRFIREEFNADYRAAFIDDKDLYIDITEYVEAVAPALVDRIKYYDRMVEPLPLFDRYHITEQVAKALDRKVWLPSGGSLIIEATEALTVIDVNTGRNVGSSSLEETVFKNNLEAADEIARQLRLRDIGGIIVIDFIDMEVKENRDAVVKRFREALSRDKTRTQVFNISELGLVEMTRKRIGEGLLETVAEVCETCDGRGRIIPREFGH